jgi:hypothetical protein
MNHLVLAALNSGSLRVQPSPSFVGEINVMVTTKEGTQPFLFESGIKIDLLQAFSKEVLLANPHVLELIGTRLQMV